MNWIKLAFDFPLVLKCFLHYLVQLKEVRLIILLGGKQEILSLSSVINVYDRVEHIVTYVFSLQFHI